MGPAWIEKILSNVAMFDFFAALEPLKVNQLAALYACI